VTDYPSWLEKFSRPFPLPDRQGLLASCAAQSATLFPRRGKDVMSHVRHVTPGDFRNKLRPETIARLDEVFAEALARLGYAR
jgi:hypothetical protein